MQTTSMSSLKTTAEEKVTTRVQLGAASAAFVAGGIGCFLVGLFTTLAEISPNIANTLNWSNPVGPLSGKVGVSLIGWLISWLVLHRMWNGKVTDFSKSLVATLILIGIGFLLTFPPVFELLAGA